MRMGWFNGMVCMVPHTEEEEKMLSSLLEILKSSTVFSMTSFLGKSDIKYPSDPATVLEFVRSEKANE